MRKKISTRFLSLALALVVVLGLIPATTAFAAGDYSTGGWDQVQDTTDVVDANGAYVGRVYAGEGVTVMYLEGNRAYIEYSGPSKPKQGFVSVFDLGYFGGFSQTALGLVTTSSKTYYSPGTAHYAGSVSAGEYVAVLCKTSSWSYIEYNISGGMRKRAFIPTSSLQCYSSDIRSNYYHVQQLGEYVDITTKTTVYAGPNPDTYPSIGSIDAGDEVWDFWTFYDADGREMKYVSYPTSSGEKYGYIYVD